MRWLITGGCGFIGRNLVKELCARKTEKVRILDNLSVGTIEDLAEVCSFVQVAHCTCGVHEFAVELVVGDITDKTLVRRAMQKVEVVVHLAAQTGVPSSVDYPFRDFETNVAGTLDCLEGARLAGAERFVFASSCAALGDRSSCAPLGDRSSRVPPGDHPAECDEQTIPCPKSPYGAGKLAGEGYCQAYSAAYGLGTVILRFSNVFGPLSNRKTSVVAEFIRRALAGEPPVVYGDGTQTRDFLFVTDLVRCIIAAAQSQASGEIFNVATGVETSINDLVYQLQRQPRLRTSPLHTVHERNRRGEVSRSSVDISKAKRLLAWTARRTLPEGLEETVDWFAERYSEAPNCAA